MIRSAGQYATFPGKPLSVLQVDRNERKKLGFIVAFIPLCLFIACSKDSSRDTGNLLTGTWQWERTDGGIAFHIHETPQSTGKNIELEFMSGNRYAVYANGVLSSSGTYELLTKTCIHDQTGKSFINFSSSTDHDMMIEKIGEEVLNLSDESLDGIASQYKSKQGSNN